MTFIMRICKAGAQHHALMQIMINYAHALKQRLKRRIKMMMSKLYMKAGEVLIIETNEPGFMTKKFFKRKYELECDLYGHVILREL